MPVDEWCDPASGCGSPGVNDDPQMNGASVAALKFAAEAALEVNLTSFFLSIDFGISCSLDLFLDDWSFFVCSVCYHFLVVVSILFILLYVLSLFTPFRIILVMFHPF